jgi:hypothetical protein
MKSKILLLSLTILGLLSSCTNLDEELFSQVESEDYGKTASEVETIVGGAYSSLRGFGDDISNSYPTCEYVFFLNECVSDEACIPTRVTHWDDGGRYREAQRHEWTADNAMILSAWRYCFQGVADVNAIIYQVNQSELSEEDKVVVNSEPRGIRAYYYYLLLDMFGNVPIVTDFEDKELPANSSRQDVFDFVESELLEIMDYLPDGVVYGRFTQNVANTLLARLYLNAEVFTGTPRWQDCISASERVTGYSLEPDYFSSFLTENQGSQEIIFAIPYDSEAGTVGNYLHSMTFHYNQKYAFSATADYPWCGNGISAQPGVYSSFEEADRRRGSLLIGEQINLATGAVINMDSGDPLIYTEEIENFENAKQNEGARLFKYEVQEGESWERDHDWVLMRYAEVLMMQAECYVRLGTPDLARPFVEQIRTRAGLETPENITLDFLNDEWLKEFVFEGHRRTHNIRFGDFFEPWWEKGQTPQYRGIYPIPQSELDKNKNLTQNPNY